VPENMQGAAFGDYWAKETDPDNP